MNIPQCLVIRLIWVSISDVFAMIALTAVRNIACPWKTDIRLMPSMVTGVVTQCLAARSKEHFVLL